MCKTAHHQNVIEPPTNAVLKAMKGHADRLLVSSTSSRADTQVAASRRIRNTVPHRRILSVNVEQVYIIYLNQASLHLI